MLKQTSQNSSVNAYGTFLFKDGGYLPGILLIAHKLRELSNKDIKLICCHTDDIEDYVLEAISLVYDDVQPIDYLKFGKNRVGRQSPLPYMFTRFRFLQLIQLNKVLIFDADMLPLASFDDLFELNAPAGVLNESKNNMKGSQQTTKKLDKWEWHDKYEPQYGHGKTIPKEITDKPLLLPDLNMGINGGLMLLKPSANDFDTFLDWCHQPENKSAIEKMPWPDMQAITAFYSGKWTNIDAKYLGLYGYPNIASLNGIHFIGPKPWQWRAKGFAYRLNKYPDYKLWAEEYLAMCSQRADLLKYKQLANLKQQIEAALS
jgi:alpha-N-acetylglucosamine transferase